MTAVEFNFDSGCTTPYLSAPSSPRGFGNYLCYYTSAPPSPTSASSVYDQFGTGKPCEENRIKDVNGVTDDNEETGGFEFEIGLKSMKGVEEAHLTATADELFEAGMIRPLNPTQETSHSPDRDMSGRRTVERSQSPLREELINSRQESKTTTVIKSSTTKKWSFIIKDFFLFRSASEGRITGNRKDPLWKHTAALMTACNANNSSFRSTNNGGSSSMRREVSPHERRKTFLPYRQELLGCLGFNPSIEGIYKAFGSITGGSSRGSKGFGSITGGSSRGSKALESITGGSSRGSKITYITT